MEKEIVRAKSMGFLPVAVERKALRTFWNRAQEDAEKGKETGALIGGRINLELASFEVDEIERITHGMSKEEIERRFSSLERLLRDEFGINVKIEGAVEIKRFLTKSHWPKGHIIGDVHTHPNISEGIFFPLTFLQHREVDVENAKRMCKSLAQALEVKNYYYLSLVLPSPYPDTKLLWDILFEAIAKEKNMKELEAKQEYGIQLAEEQLKEVKFLKPPTSLEEAFGKELKKSLGPMLAYLYEFADFSTPYCKPPSVENYREFLRKAENIYKGLTKRKDFPKNKLLDWMRKRQFLYQLGEYSFIEQGYPYSNIFSFLTTPHIAHYDEEKTETKVGYSYLKGKEEVGRSISEFLRSYKKHFRRDFHGLLDVAYEQFSSAEVVLSTKKALEYLISLSSKTKEILQPEL